MPAVTRSASRSVAPIVVPVDAARPSTLKRKAPPIPARLDLKKSRSIETKSTPDTPPAQATSTAFNADVTLVPAVLTFSFEQAKQHLIDMDHRFEDIFSKMPCRPFELLEQVHPFRALVTAILGQQISWMAARSINHKFVRLYDPSIPENHADYAAIKSPTSFFPTPAQVAKTDITTLKTAGLSTRKAEYVQDLASRFADGRLSTHKLIAANDEELAEMLIEVRGIGRWTVDMFAIFSLRRPDILPVGDLGVQRGILRWFLSLHSPSHKFSISPEKIQSDKEPPAAADDDALPIFGQDKKSQDSDVTFPDISSAPPASGASTPYRGHSESLPTMPSPFTPSVNKILNSRKAAKIPQSLPEGLSVSILESRLDSKRKIKGAILTPKEMEDLTECWKPYRSVGVYYMWSLADADGKK